MSVHLYFQVVFLRYYLLISKFLFFFGYLNCIAQLISSLSLFLQFMNETNSTLPGLQFNLTSANMTIGEVMTIPIMVSIPPNSSSEVHVDMKLQVNDSAHMTVKDMRVISAGRNLACLYDFSNVNYTYRSTQDTTQIDFGIINLGLVTNTGKINLPLLS